MTKRENLLSLLRREGYDYHPNFFELCPDRDMHFHQVTKSVHSYEEYFDMPWRNISDGRLNKDLTDIHLSYYDKTFKENTYIDPYGVAHEPGDEDSKHLTLMHHPLKDMTTLEELQAYPFPDYNDANYSHQSLECLTLHNKDLCAMGHMQMTIWEEAWYLRSMEQLMMDMILDPEKATYILDAITANAKIRAEHYALAGCDLIFLGDDIGMQETTLMSEDMYVTWLKPRLKIIIDSIKLINPDILVLYHSCGYVTPFISHLIDVGVDVLNPVQPECMSFEEIHQQFGNQLSFIGTIGTQTTMPFGSVNEVEKSVAYNLNIAGKKGGLLCAPTHILEPEVPWDNILAYVHASQNYCTKK